VESFAAAETTEEKLALYIASFKTPEDLKFRVNCRVWKKWQNTEGN